MQNVIPFDFETNAVRVAMIDGALWFVTTDVCRPLEIGNPSQAIARLDEDEVKTVNLNTLNFNEGIRGNPNATVISESGLYALIFTSRQAVPQMGEERSAARHSAHWRISAGSRMRRSSAYSNRQASASCQSGLSGQPFGCTSGHGTCPRGQHARDRSVGRSRRNARCGHVHDAWLSAGPGIANARRNIIDHLAFRHDWLSRIGVSASQSCLARVLGDSMFPTLSPGDMVLLDMSRTDPPVRSRGNQDKRRPMIWALLDDGQARIKRIERPNADTMMLVSDNPDHPPELRMGPQLAHVQIIGKVIWWGHTHNS